MKRLLAMALVAVAVCMLGTPAQARKRPVSQAKAQTQQTQMQTQQTPAPQTIARTSVTVSSPKVSPLENYQVTFTVDRRDRQGKGGTLYTTQLLQFDKAQTDVTIKVLKGWSFDGNEYKGYELLRREGSSPVCKVVKSGSKSEKNIVFDIRTGDVLVLDLLYAKQPQPVGTVVNR